MNNDTKYTGYLKHIADDKLLSQIKILVRKERHIQIEVIHHLAEINARQLYLKRSFSSLHEYATRGLGYSDGAAQRRIKTMRLCSALPAVEELIVPGNLNLTSASQLQTAFERQERIAPDEVWNDEQKLDLIQRVEGKSTRETERVIADAAPEVVPPRERSRYLGNGQWEIRMVVPEEVWKQFETLKDLLSHRIPTRSCGELIALLARDAMAKYDPRCRVQGPRARASARRVAADESASGPDRDLAGVTPGARPTDRRAAPALDAALPSRHTDAVAASSRAPNVCASMHSDTAVGGGPAPAAAAVGGATPLADQGSTPALEWAAVAAVGDASAQPTITPAPERTASARASSHLAVTPAPAKLGVQHGTPVAVVPTTRQPAQRSTPAPEQLGVQHRTPGTPGHAAVQPAQPLTPAPEYVTARRRTVTRHVPAAVRRAVWVRDEGRCRFIDPATGPAAAPPINCSSITGSRGRVAEAMTRTTSSCSVLGITGTAVSARSAIRSRWRPAGSAERSRSAADGGGDGTCREARARRDPTRNRPASARARGWCGIVQWGAVVSVRSPRGRGGAASCQGGAVVPRAGLRAGGDGAASFQRRAVVSVRAARAGGGLGCVGPVLGCGRAAKMVGPSRGERWTTAGGNAGRIPLRPEPRRSSR